MPAGTKHGLDPRTRTPRLHFVQRIAFISVVALTGLVTSQSQAQDSAPAVAPVEATPPPAPPPPPEPAPEPAPAVETPPEPAPTAEPAPEAAPPAAPVLKMGVGFRTGLAAVLDDPVVLTLDDGLVDQVNIRPYLTGQLTDNIGFFLQYEIGTLNGLGHFAILDAIAQVKIVDEFQIWLGHHIPANDRNNMNGPFFNNGWNFPILVPTYSMDSGARDRGVTFWGLVADGMLKYQASIVDLQKGRDISTSRFAGRVTLHLLEPENFYYNSGTYYGGQDVFALGAFATYQKGIDGGPDVNMDGDVENDYAAFSFDAMFEKNLGSGTLTLDAIYWNTKGAGLDYVVNQGSVDSGAGVNFTPPGHSMMFGASWLFPEKMGIGQLQPNVRLQYAAYDDQAKQAVLDVGIGYIIDGYNHRWFLNYRHVAVEGEDNDQSIIQIGTQMMM